MAITYSNPSLTASYPDPDPDPDPDHDPDAHRRTLTTAAELLATLRNASIAKIVVYKEVLLPAAFLDGTPPQAHQP